MGDRATRQPGLGPSRFAAWGALYFAGAVLAAAYLRTADEVTLFWPAAGIAYGALVRYGDRRVAALPLVLVPFHLLFWPVPPLFLLFSVASNVMALLAAHAYLVRHSDLPLRLRTGDSLVVLRGGLVLSAVSAVIGTAGLVASGMVAPADAGASATLWALGDLLGVTTVAPSVLLLTAAHDRHRANSPRHEPTGRRERALWALALVLSFGSIHAIGMGSSAYRLALISLPLMLLLWAAVRFSTALTAVATMTVVVYMSLVTGIGLGGFTPPSTVLDTVVVLLMLNLIAVIPVLLSLSGLEQRGTAQALWRRATFDGLTGLLNRSAFEERARKRLESTGDATLLYLDLDNFKVVNDSASHLAGDALLRAVAGVVAERTDRGAVVARTGGDEFALLLPCTRAGALSLARRLLREIEALRLSWGNVVLTSTASIGIAPAEGGERDYDALFSHADSACFAAKELGGNRLCVADAGSAETRSRATAMHSALRVREALEHRRFELHCQPIVPLCAAGSDGLAFEVLLRWRQPDGSLHPPAEFIAAAERFRLGPRLDRFVVDATLAWLEAHPDAAARTRSCGINLSGTTLVDDDFADYLAARLRRSPVPPGRICFEITETSVIRDRARAQRFIQRMRALGCRFALDDFGTGFCSFGYLRDLDVDLLKIDGSFIHDLDESMLSQAVVRSIAEIAHVLGKQTVAEQVETEAQRERAVGMGVDFAQGYLFQRPLPIEAFFAAAQ